MSYAVRRLAPRSVAALDGARRLSTDPTLRVSRSRFERWITPSARSARGTRLWLAGATSALPDRRLVRATRVLTEQGAAFRKG